MASIVTYDIPAKHVEFKKEMSSLGYKDRIADPKCQNGIFFPNTTLYHAAKTPSQAREDTKFICSKLSIKLERCVATIWENWAAICGEEFK